MPTYPASSRPSVKPRIGVSSCLLGEPVRFNGGHSRCRFLTDELGTNVDWVPFCPEIAIGLGSPRETLRLTTQARLVNRAGTADHTPAVAALPLPPVTGLLRCPQSPVGRGRVQGRVLTPRLAGGMAPQALG